MSGSRPAVEPFTMQEQILHETLDNGLTLVAQPMPWLESAAFSIAVPAGYRYDPASRLGLSNFACEMVQRGAGPRDSRQWIEDLDALGLDYRSSASLYNTTFSGAMQAPQLFPALTMYADLLRRPRFPADQLEDGRQVCFQEIAALEDDLPQRALQQLRTNFYGDVDGRSSEGTLESVAAITLEEIQRFHRQYFQPQGLILACAGKLDFDELREHVVRLFDDWEPVLPAPCPDSQPSHGYQHIDYDSEQTHIGIAYQGVPYAAPDYYQNRGAVGVLSGGMSSRLFHEVREKRGLCYTVFASCHTLKTNAAVLCYSGTTNDRAQETLDVILAELHRLAEGITEDELRRLQVQIRSGLVMQQESCRSRASSIAGDWFHLGRVRPLEEVLEQINALSVESINAYLRQNPPANFDVVTLGPQPLEYGHGVSSAPAR